jgi:hypothetical protein
VLKLFLAFASSFQTRHVHNMLVYMLDPHFKNPQLIKDYVGLELAMQVALEYDSKILMPLLLIVYHSSTPNSATVTFVASTLDEPGLFGSLAQFSRV